MVMVYSLNKYKHSEVKQNLFQPHGRGISLYLHYNIHTIFGNLWSFLDVSQYTYKTVPMAPEFLDHNTYCNSYKAYMACKIIQQTCILQTNPYTMLAISKISGPDIVWYM